MPDKGHILVVEDESHLAIGIKYNLQAEGYVVTSVGDGPAALRALEENPRGYDLVILDLMLPGMSGYAVCEAIRASGRMLPVLILSARTLAEDRTRGFDVGADQYMMKPFDLDELLSRVRLLLSRYRQRERAAAAAPQAIEQFEFGQARIDFTRFSATVAGEPVRLTRMEMELLRYFVENADRVVRREELLENVWGMQGHAATRAPDQFIMRLRKTFEPNPAQPRYFLTIRDLGYRFVPYSDQERPAEETPASEDARP